jgi:hypothetical protein
VWLRRVGNDRLRFDFFCHSISLTDDVTPRTFQEPQCTEAQSGAERHDTSHRTTDETRSKFYKFHSISNPRRRTRTERTGRRSHAASAHPVTATHVRTTTRARTTCFQGTIDSWPPASHPPCPLEPPARSNSTHQLPRGPVPRSGPAPALPRAACPSPRRPSRDNARSRVALNRVLPCVCYSYEPHLCLDALVINQSAVPSAAW